MKRDRFEVACLWLAIPLGIYWSGGLVPDYTPNHFAAAVVGGGGAWLCAQAAIWIRRAVIETNRLRREGRPVDDWR